MKNNNALVFSFAAGAAGFLLRSRIYALYLDEKGLLIPNRMSTALWVLTIAGIVIMAAAVRFGNQSLTAMPRPACGMGSVLFGVGLIAAGLNLPGNSLPAVEPLARPLSAIAGIGMAAGGAMQLRGKPVPYVSRLLGVIFPVVYMICCYRSWSARPQIMDHAFDVLACVSLTLTAFHLCAESAGIAGPKKKTFFSLCTIFLCMTACAVGQCVPLYLGGVCLALTAEER